MILKKAADLVQLTYPSEKDQVHVLQFADGESNVAFSKSEGGDLVWSLLELCDGVQTLSGVLRELRRRFDGPELLWGEELPALLRDLIAWRVLDVVQDTGS
jgi:hypothetical protein